MPPDCWGSDAGASDAGATDGGSPGCEWALSSDVEVGSAMTSAAAKILSIGGARNIRPVIVAANANVALERTSLTDFTDLAVAASGGHVLVAFAEDGAASTVLRVALARCQ